jgi:hypothetical protein
VANGTFSRLKTYRERLYKRALALSHPEKDQEMGEIMMALALVMEALEVIDSEQSRISALLRQ